MHATALIAEDEPLLAAHLASELTALWPQLEVVGSVGHGAAAVSAALAQRPDVLFLDIRMPGQTGLEAAQALAEDWPEQAMHRFPLIVFVTAYDHYALEAFERAAVDYVLKPVRRDRLAQTCERLKLALVQRRGQPDAHALDRAIEQLKALVGGPGRLDQTPAAATAASTAATSATSATSPASAPGAPLRVIQASAGPVLHMVPVDEVIYFEAADKYVRVITAQKEYLIRTSLRELQPQLDPSRFWQVHRGTLVRADAIDSALRDDNGRLQLNLRGHPDRLQVSRMYAHLFKAM